MSTRGAVHLQGGRSGGDGTKVIAYHHGVISIVQGAIDIRDTETWTRCPHNRFSVSIPLVSQELTLCLRSQVHALPAEDQAGSLRVRYNLRLEVFEDLFVQLGGGDGVAGEFTR